MGNQMSDPVLSKLLAADSDLEGQAAKLLAQLAAIQAKRASLQSVLEIFEPDKTTAVVKNGAIAATQIIDAPVASPTQKPAKTTSKRGTKATKDKPAQPRKPATLWWRQSPIQCAKTPVTESPISWRKAFAMASGIALRPGVTVFPSSEGHGAPTLLMA